MNEDLRARAQRWVDDDPDPTTQAELRGLLAAADLGTTDVADRFASTLEFGTAGLRGVLGAGPNRMNRAVVRRTSDGLARALLTEVPGAAARGVVIGYDGRLLSREFAEDTAGVLAAHGVAAHLFPRTVPTPALAYAVRKLGGAAGVMVTASHNPPEYNGYKVYWSNAAQIVPPVDATIAAAIEKAPPAREVRCLSADDARAKGLLRDVGDDVLRAYLDEIRMLQVYPPARGAVRDLPIVYTPLHGVGAELCEKALAEAGFTNVATVPEQAKPDGHFPTVAFPNPEEKGAMDLSFALATSRRAELILANDPDADRLAVAVPGPRGYVQFTGNQVGILLGHYLLTERKLPAGSKPLMLASVVSSPMLGVICSALGARYEETLTGFKWIANRAMELENEGYTFLFGYEEALGYTVGPVVRDKDGVSAAVLMAEMASVLRERGQTLLGELEAIHRRHGLFVSSQVTVTKKGVTGAAELKALMERLRKAAPRTVGAHTVRAIADYQIRERLLLAPGKEGSREPLALPKTNMVIYELEGGSRVIARPSGTEPKVKFYFDVREAMTGGETLGAAETRAGATMKALADAFVALAG